MDQVKIGRFIAEKRREQGLTQMQLAEALDITDRAVSKWETGKSLPDASIMLELCRLLKITVNDLLNGEVVSMERYNEAMENHLLEMVKQKETKDRQLLRMEIVLSAVSLLFLFAMIAVGAVFMKQGQPKWIFFLLLGIGLFQFFFRAVCAAHRANRRLLCMCGMRTPLCAVLCRGDVCNAHEPHALSQMPRLRQAQLAEEGAFQRIIIRSFTALQEAVFCCQRDGDMVNWYSDSGGAK